MKFVLLRMGAVVLALPMILFVSVSTVGAGEADDSIADLRLEVEELRRRDAESRRKLEELENKLDALQGAAPVAAETESPQSALDRVVEELDPTASENTQSGDVWSRRAGPATLRLIDISMDILTAGGWSSASNSEIKDLEAGSHDPRRRGFTLQQAELSFTGAIDPYLTAEVHTVFGEDHVELEEAFFTTQSLPYGLQVEAGQMLTEFGLINPTHSHAWAWIDQPVIISRLFGPEGLRAPGIRVGWLTPLPWFSEIQFGVQSADAGEGTYSFLSEEEIGGRPAVTQGVHNLGDLLYLGRWNHSWDVTDEVTMLGGVSGLHGPNSTGKGAQTWIYGADLKLRWRPASNFRGWPFVVWQSEIIKRDFDAKPYTAEPADEETESDGLPTTDLDREILRDWGLYTQLLYGFTPQWSTGLRYEYASGARPSVGGRGADPFRDNRHRVSPLVIWQPSEYSRFRLQYNFDEAGFLDSADAHSVWVGGEVLYGAHPAHAY